MIKYAFTLFMLFTSTFCFSIEWSDKRDKLRSVYKFRSNSDQLEVVKLYYDRSAEYVTYRIDNNESYLVNRSFGKYELNSKVLILNGFDDSRLNATFFKDDQGKLFEKKMDRILNKDNYVMRIANRKNYQAPFYIHPYSREIIQNDEFKDHVNLNSFFNYQTRSSINDKERFEIILSFIMDRVKVTNDDKREPDDLSHLLFGKNRTIGSSKIAKIMHAAFQDVGLNSHIISGKYKSGSNGEYLLHNWLGLEFNQKIHLYDPALGDQWMDVDPAVFIYSHLPFDDSYQLLIDPICEFEFMNLPYLKPNSRSAQFFDFLPNTAEVEVKDKFQVLLNTSFSVLSVLFKEGDGFKSIDDYEMVSSGGKTLLTIPIKDVEQNVVVIVDNSLEIQYNVINNGNQNSIISDYYAENQLRSRQNVQNKGGRFEIKEVGTSAFSQAQKDWYRYSGLTQMNIDHPLIQKAIQFYGIKDIPGNSDNATIVKFFKETGHDDIASDEFSWCSVFISYCAKELDLSYPRLATARSWLKLGRKTTRPKPGDIVVFWRETKNSWKGHVGIFLGFTPDKKEVITLGGNQDDAVVIKPYPKSQVLGYRKVLGY